ncbi:MAG: hypothetical protein ACKVJK_01530 [Methylophagaceae bacterium]|jgi:hypothetical protein
MIARTLVSLLLLTTIVSGCSLLPQRQVEIISKPVPINIIQPQLPRPINLADIQMSVVSEAVITNPCKRSISFEPQKFDDKGIEQLKRPKACDLSERDNPLWPVGYTYLDRFLDENKIAGGGSIVFVATTVKNYEVQAANFQELRRYIRELGEVIVYYKEVTTNTKKDSSTGGQPDNN